MTETTEEIIARLAKERAKTILENSDYWSGPGSAKTSAEAIQTLISLHWSLAPPADDDDDFEIEIREKRPAAVKSKRADKAKEQSAATAEPDAEPEPADA